MKPSGIKKSHLFVPMVTRRPMANSNSASNVPLVYFIFELEMATTYQLIKILKIFR